VNVGDSNGALVRAMAATVHDRAASSLTIDELIWRTFAAEHRGDPGENAQLLTALEAALAREPAHAEGWVCLALLYEDHRVTDVGRQAEASGSPFVQMVSVDLRIQVLEFQLQAGTRRRLARGCRTG
jgi:hypothetical protein